MEVTSGVNPGLSPENFNLVGISPVYHNYISRIVNDTIVKCEFTNLIKCVKMEIVKPTFKER